jgi:hypothetical protein
VKVSFFGGIDFGRVGEPSVTDHGGIVVASSLDLLATKLRVILPRAEARDYRDVAALLAAGEDLASGLAAALALFGSAFPASEALKALSFFGDGDLHTLGPAERRRLAEEAAAVRDLPAVAIRARTLAS